MHADVIALTKVLQVLVLIHSLKLELVQQSLKEKIKIFIYFSLWCQLTCLVLPREHSNLLQTRSIWNADQASEACSVVEKILHLEPVEVCIYVF